MIPVPDEGQGCGVAPGYHEITDWHRAFGSRWSRQACPVSWMAAAPWQADTSAVQCPGSCPTIFEADCIDRIEPPSPDPGGGERTDHTRSVPIMPSSHVSMAVSPCVDPELDCLSRRRQTGFKPTAPESIARGRFTDCPTRVGKSACFHVRDHSDSGHGGPSSPVPARDPASHPVEGGPCK